MRGRRRAARRPVDRRVRLVGRSIGLAGRRRTALLVWEASCQIHGPPPPFAALLRLAPPPAALGRPPSHFAALRPLAPPSIVLPRPPPATVVSASPKLQCADPRRRRHRRPVVATTAAVASALFGAAVVAAAGLPSPALLVADTTSGLPEVDQAVALGRPEVRSGGRSELWDRTLRSGAAARHEGSGVLVQRSCSAGCCRFQLMLPHRRSPLEAGSFSWGGSCSAVGAVQARLLPQSCQVRCQIQLVMQSVCSAVLLFGGVGRAADAFSSPRGVFTCGAQLRAVDGVATEVVAALIVEGCAGVKSEVVLS